MNFFEIFNRVKSCTEQVYSDYHCGFNYKNNDFFNENKKIEIIIFQDAFEVCNPLGSSKKKHKLIGVYMMIGNVPPEYRSNTKNIQLVLLCKESYIKDFGFDIILKPLIQDLMI